MRASAPTYDSSSATASGACSAMRPPPRRGSSSNGATVSCPAGVDQQPCATSLRRPPLSWTTPYPQAAVPGSMPTTFTRESYGPDRTNPVQAATRCGTLADSARSGERTLAQPSVSGRGHWPRAVAVAQVVAARTVGAFTAAVTVAAATAGCSNGDHPRTAAEASFLARANAICRSSLAAAPPTPTPTKTVAEAIRAGRDTPAARAFILRFVSYALAVGEPMQRRFRQLYPPAAFRNDVRRINRLDDEQSAKLLLMRQDAIAGHIGAAATVHQTDHADAVEVARLNEKLGLNSCARR